MLGGEHHNKKRIRSWRILYLILTWTLGGCEDVIDVDVPEPETRLVVNGIVRVDSEQEFAPIEIKVTESSGFFDENTVTQLESAVILVGERDPEDPFSTSFGRIDLLELTPNSGIYAAEGGLRTEFLNANTEFFLIVEHKGKRYAGQTFYSSTVQIDNLEQGDDTLFDEDDVEVKITFTDVPDETNYYVFDFGFGNFLGVDDQFIDGQQFEFSYFYDEELGQNQEIEVSILGADQQFFNYIDLLVEQTENDGGVFETPAATVRGNMFDVTGLDNVEIFDNVNRPNSFALGYFAVVQEAKATITIE